MTRKQRATETAVPLRATAKAHPNIALVKYWGKRDERRILPHQSSVSVTLSPLSVTTSVEFGVSGRTDQVSINGQPATSSERQRVVDIVSLVRRQVPYPLGASKVVSVGTFPKAAGLASSAAAFAALSVAARQAAGMPRNTRAESVLARQGSGSASRSIEGGFCRWNRGSKADGSDSFAVQLFGEDHWPQLRLLVCMVSAEEKEVKSRDGMRNTVKTSPYYPAWIVDAKKRRKRSFLCCGEETSRPSVRCPKATPGACTRRHLLPIHRFRTSSPRRSS